MTFWCLAPGVSWKTCETRGEMAVYVGFTGTAHVLNGLGCFVMETCVNTPSDLNTLQSLAQATFEVEDGADVVRAIKLTVRQMSELGILVPCPQPS